MNPLTPVAHNMNRHAKKKKNPQVKRSKHTRPRRNQRLQLTNAVFAQQLFNQNIGPSRAGLPANTTADRGERRHNSHKSAAEFPLRTHAPCASHTEACLNRKKKLAHAWLPTKTPSSWWNDTHKQVRYVKKLHLSPTCNEKRSMASLSRSRCWQSADSRNVVRTWRVFQNATPHVLAWVEFIFVIGSTGRTQNTNAARKHTSKNEKKRCRTDKLQRPTSEHAKTSSGLQLRRRTKAQ